MDRVHVKFKRYNNSRKQLPISIYKNISLSK